jgi:hypothetical protein
MNSTVNLQFRYSERDYVRALRAHYASRLRLRFDFAAVLIGIAVGAYTWRSPDLHWISVACLTGSIVLALVLIVGFAVVPPLVFRSQSKFRDDYSLAFSPENIHFRTAHIDSVLEWSLYSRALIDAHSYILYYGSRQFTVIPKRAFESVEQQLAFEKMLSERVSQVDKRE